MKNYQSHLEEQYHSSTFERKIDYIKYNFGNLINEVALKKGTVLEIGPGMGECIKYLNSKKIRNIDIIDNDKSILGNVKNNFKIRKTFINENILTIDNKLEYYDLIILIQVLEHLPVKNHHLIVKLLYSHLKKNGSILIVVPNANNPLGIVERYGDLQHQTSFTERSLRDLAAMSGIDNFDMNIMGYKIPPCSPVNVIRICLQKMLHIILFVVMIINGGTYFKVMTPNIVLILHKKS